MKHLLFLMILFLSVASCKSSKRAKDKNTNTSKVIIGDRSPAIDAPATSKANHLNTHSKSLPDARAKAYNIVEYAKQFKGVRYQFGGATRSGMDCSGLVFEAFRAHDILLPRISRDMAKNGEKISLDQVAIGDLLFFKTGSRRNDISHVGLVVSAHEGQIAFIHSTTSAGVIISSITETYWDKSFTEARRIL